MCAKCNVQCRENDPSNKTWMIMSYAVKSCADVFVLGSVQQLCKMDVLAEGEWKDLMIQAHYPLKSPN